MKKTILFLSLFFTCLANAADTVRVYNTSSPTFTAVTNSTFTLYSDAASGDATSEGAPAKVYIPMEYNTSSRNRDYYYTNTSGTTNELFAYSTDTTHAATYLGYILKYPLSLTIGSTAKYVYAAVKMADGYKAISKSTSAYSNVSSAELNFTLSPQKLCEFVASETTNCSSFNVDGTMAEVSKSFTLYFFLSENGTLVNSPIPTATYTGGIYIQTNLSNRVYAATDLTVTLSNLKRGDKRVIGDFLNSATMEDFKKAAVFFHSGAACATDSTISSCTGSFNNDYTEATQNGSFTVANLTNGSAVTISIALLDKYGFSTVLSNSASATPTQIEELLKKQNCYLLTAGFGEEHFVIDYFRNFRDKTLSHYYLGQQFIKYYYKYAPSFALSIYNNEVIRFFIRMSAYVLYYIMNNFSWLIGIVGFMSIILIYLKKQKKFS